MPRGGAREGAGRKPRPPEEHRSQAIRVWVTPAEMERIEGKRRDGESMSTCVRRLALDATKGTRERGTTLYLGLNVVRATIGKDGPIFSKVSGPTEGSRLFERRNGLYVNGLLFKWEARLNEEWDATNRDLNPDTRSGSVLRPPPVNGGE